MQSDSAVKLETTLKTKISLIIFGIFLSFVLLEVVLRLGGFVLLSMQEYRNRQTIKQKGSYRIMCLGESTTRGQYPAFLEEILNQRDAGIKFSVIDKGIDGTTTSAILERLNADIDQYHPDLVVTMMGINDQSGQIPYEAATTSKAILLFRSLKTYKLIRLLWVHILTKAEEIGFYAPNGNKQLFGGIQTHIPRIVTKEAYAGLTSTEDALKKAIELHPKNVRAYFELGRYYHAEGKLYQAKDILKKIIELYPGSYYAYICLGWLYQGQGKFSQTENIFKKAIGLDHQNVEAYLELGKLCRTEGKFSSAEYLFKKAIGLDHQNVEAYYELGRLCQDQGKFSQAEDIFKKVIRLYPENVNAYFELGWLYQVQNKLSQAEDTFKTVIKLHPGNYIVYIFLGWLYRDHGKLSQAEDTLKKAIELHPKNVYAYLELGRFYHAQDKLSQAEDAFKRAIELDPMNADAYFELGRHCQAKGKLSQAQDAFKKTIELEPDKNFSTYEALSVLYEEMGKPELAKEYAKKANRWWLCHYGDLTINNYRKLKDVLDKRKIRFVCVQYPVRSIDPLKKIFEGNGKGIIFVDNEKIFKDVLKKGGSMAYFRDMFGVNFGHATKKGNRLLAENIADVILREAFHK